MSWSTSTKVNHGSRSGGFDEFCNYCRERGHWKPALSVPVRNLPNAYREVLDKAEIEEFSGFEAFVSD